MPVTRPQIHTPISNGIPIKININGIEIIVKTTCQTPVFVLPAINVPNPGRINTFSNNEAIASPCPIFPFLTILFILGNCCSYVLVQLLH